MQTTNILLIVLILIIGAGVAVMLFGNTIIPSASTDSEVVVDVDEPQPFDFQEIPGSFNFNGTIEKTEAVDGTTLMITVLVSAESLANGEVSERESFSVPGSSPEDLALLMGDIKSGYLVDVTAVREEDGSLGIVSWAISPPLEEVIDEIPVEDVPVAPSQPSA